MSQNQFPGQGGQQGGQPQYPQGGQQYPQGGQQYPQGGQQYPQGGQQYPQGGQQYPQGGQPQYPQGGQPQYPQGGQPQYPQGGQQYPQGAAQYRPAGAAGAFAGAGGGFQQQPPPPKNTGMVIGIVVAGLAAVALLGWLLMSVFGGQSDPGPTPTPTVSTSTGPGPDPAPSTPSTDPDPDPAPSTSAPSTPAPSGSVEVGLGIGVVPAAGWEQTGRDEVKNFTQLGNGSAVVVAQAFRVEGSPSGKQVVAAYMEQITANMTKVSAKEPADMDVKNDRLSVGIASWSGTRATAQGSVQLQYLSIISVRDDGLAAMSTLILPQGVSLQSVQSDYLEMTNSLLSSQLRA